MRQDPLISCLMVTRAQRERQALMAASLGSFARQTYANRELIVVISGHQDDDKAWLSRELTSLPGHVMSRIVEAPDDPPLGVLRNLSMREAEGDFLCQWDDDDMCHPERLARQFDHLQEGGYDATYLRDVLQYFPSRHEIYWTNWLKTEVGAHPGTFMVSRTAQFRYDVDGPAARLGEDSAVARHLQQTARVGVLAGAPHLYMYTSHGFNSWDDDHHAMLAERLSVSRSFILRREQELRQAVGAFGMQIDGVAMCGSNGPAFQFGSAISPMLHPREG